MILSIRIEAVYGSGEFLGMEESDPMYNKDEIQNVELKVALDDDWANAKTIIVKEFKGIDVIVGANPTINLKEIERFE